MRGAMWFGAAAALMAWACGSTVTFITGETVGGSGGAATSNGTGTSQPASSSSSGVTCGFGSADCDGDPANGCETDTLNDPGHCGGCNSVCASGGNGVAVCVKGTCQLECNDGFGDCDGSAKNGCETPLASDPKNCGACKVACMVACVAGHCADQKAIAKGLNHPTAIAVDAVSVYWIELGSVAAFTDGAVKQMPKDLSAPPATLASKLARPVALAIAGDTLYWATGGTAAANFADGTVQALKFGNPAPIVIASGQQDPASVAVDGNTVYWTNAGTPPSFSDGAVMSLTMAPNAKPVVVAANQKYPQQVAVDGGYVYWLASGTQGINYSDGALWSAPVGKVAPPKLLASGLNGAFHFSPAFGKFIVVAETNGYQVTEVVSDGSNKKVLYPTGKLLPFAITVGANGGIYHTALKLNEYGGAIQRGDLNGKLSTLYDTNRISYGIAADKTAIYWTEIGEIATNLNDGVVMMGPP